MSTKLFSSKEIEFKDHPKFSGVHMAVFVTGKDSDSVSVCQLIIAPGITIPVHTHMDQVDSIFIVSGQGEGYVKGTWQGLLPGDYLFVPAEIEHGIRNTGSEPLVLFVHHSPPLL
jgi:quercetin dioxygenase-like cupin family protein